MKLSRCEYQIENNRPVIYLFCRENGKRVVKTDDSLVPYFYVDNPNGEYITIFGDQVSKIEINLPSEVFIIRENYKKHYEADIPFPVRYMIDKIDTLEEANLKIMYLDIETDNSGVFPDPQFAKEEIICITVYSVDMYTTFLYSNNIIPGIEHDMFHDEFHEKRYYTTEKDMMQAFLDYVASEEPDVLTGWNTLGFDFPYIINRSWKIGVDCSKLSPIGRVSISDYGDVRIMGVNLLDLLPAYRKMSEGMEDSYKLDHIGHKVLGIGKTESAENIKWMWTFSPSNLVKYNAQDVRICVELDRKLRLIEFFDEIRRLSFCQLEDTLSVSKTMDSYILRMFHGQYVFPSKKRGEKYKYKGAFVGTWAKGIYENVVLFDLKSLYPSCVCGANLSPECITDKESDNTIRIENAIVRQDIEGFLPKVIKTLFKERAAYKDLMKTVSYGSDEYNVYYRRQWAIKILLNSLYGQLGFSHSRMYEPRLAEAVTSLGREVIMWSKEILEDMGYITLYADTDSLAWSIGPELDRTEINRVLAELNESYDGFCYLKGLKSNWFQMEFEKIFRKAFYGTAKKRYAGHLIYDDGKEVDELLVMGFEVKRSDSAQLSRETQKNMLDMILRQDKSKIEVIRYIGDQIDIIIKHKCSLSDLGIPKGINRPLYTYNEKGAPANIRGARYSINELGLNISNKPKMLYIHKMSEKYKSTDVLCFDTDSQVPPGTEIDMEVMLTKTIKNKLAPIFEALEWKLSDLRWYWKGKPEGHGEQLNLFTK